MGAPYHPETNGLAERMVQTVKQALKKMGNQSGEMSAKIQRFLYSYRNAAHAATGKSPAKMLLGRELRSKLDLLRPHTRKSKEVPARFEEGQEVLARDYRPGQGKWHKGIVERRIGTYLYLVRAENRILKRHVDQLLPSKEGSVGQTEEEEEEVSSTKPSGLKIAPKTTSVSFTSQQNEPRPQPAPSQNHEIERPSLIQPVRPNPPLPPIKPPTLRRSGRRGCTSRSF
jgi:hypothetical protein